MDAHFHHLLRVFNESRQETKLLYPYPPTFAGSNLARNGVSFNSKLATLYFSVASTYTQRKYLKK